LSQAAQNELANIVTILLGFSIAATMTERKVRQRKDSHNHSHGAGGLCARHSRRRVHHAKDAQPLPAERAESINPMVGAAGISAFPMSARVIQKMGQKEDNSQTSCSCMRSAPMSAGQIGSVLAGGILLAYLS
jgi:Na+-transporting methylmalonyl-CoA/oxaloacetate decarboxylase beta subunit